tara:strand:+ start:323 stop:952 length:630 start_codon:yes stop_codon:yes gene_type:complete
MRFLKLPTLNDLNENSIVFDLGGYKGTYTGLINNICKCKIFLFETWSDHYSHCVNRFKNNDNINCFNFGLGSNNEKISMFYDKDGTNAFKEKNLGVGAQHVSIINFKDFIETQKIQFVDVMKINTEGGEFDLLEFLTHDYNKELISKIGIIQIQFHDFVPNAIERRDKIISKLRDTHVENWNHNGELSITARGHKQPCWVWEEWRLKKS